MNIKKNLGKRIKEIRLELGFTQEQLADKLNISAKSLSQIETGNNFVSAETLESLCNVLEIKPKTLFDFDKYEQSEKNIFESIVFRLEHNPRILPLLYKIVNALDE